MQNSRMDHWNMHYSKGNDFGLIPSFMLTKILQYVDKSLAKECLDIGCGTGQLTRELYHRGYTCTGIDISDEAILLAKQNTVYRQDLQYIQADTELLNTLTLPKKSYSLITCKLVYAFIDDKIRFLKSVSDILADGGLFVTITPIYQGEEKSSIAVDFDKTKTELSQFFSRINTFEGLGVTYFICSK